MAAALKSFFHAVLILSLFGKGFCQCSLNSISVSQTKTGEMVEGKPEFEVTVNNNCICTHQDVKLSCPGFKTAESVDPSIFSVDGDFCLLNGGQPFYGFSSIKFKYAWDTRFSLTPASSIIACS